MKYAKTTEGQQAFKDRSVALSARQRSAFILFDGQRTVAEVLAATQGLGVTQEDVDYLVGMNLLAPVMPMGYSQWLPDVRMGTPGQGEGFLYFGAGWLVQHWLAPLQLARVAFSAVALAALWLGWSHAAGQRLGAPALALLFTSGLAGGSALPRARTGAVSMSP